MWPVAAVIELLTLMLDQVLTQVRLLVLIRVLIQVTDGTGSARAHMRLRPGGTISNGECPLCHGFGIIIMASIADRQKR